MRVDDDEAAAEMSKRLAAEQAHDRLAKAAAAHATEIERSAARPSKLAAAYQDVRRAAEAIPRRYAQ